MGGAAPEITTALPKRLRHTGAWPLDPPRRAPKGSDLRSLQDRMDGCPAGRRPVLSGDGSERAMLIGQAPGWREIETGLPFAHDAGRRLVGWLELAGIGVEDFRTRWYVTSVGKCYPGRRPGASVDSPPPRQEVRRWSPILASEVALVAPRLLVLVGGLAHRFAFGEAARLDDVVGHALAWDNAPGAAVICLPHPSGASTWLNEPRRVSLWRAAMAELAGQWARLETGS